MISAKTAEIKRAMPPLDSNLRNWYIVRTRKLAPVKQNAGTPTLAHR